MFTKLLLCLGVITSFSSQLVRAETTANLCSLPRIETNTEQQFPDLWWAKEQFDPFNGQLIQGWIINKENNSIDLIINRQLWSVLDYINRYRLVNHMGAIAREYQYNLRVINQQEKCLAFYTCDFNPIPQNCRIDFDVREANSFEIDN